MKEQEHNMSSLIIKNKTLFTREKLAFISLVGCWEDTNFCSTNLSPRVADPGKGTGGLESPPYF